METRNKDAIHVIYITVHKKEIGSNWKVLLLGVQYSAVGLGTKTKSFLCITTV